jgi:hypothetical protein
MGEIQNRTIEESNRLFEKVLEENKDVFRRLKEYDTDSYENESYEDFKKRWIKENG